MEILELRNIPEQVAENASKIEDLKYRLDHLILGDYGKLDEDNYWTAINDFLYPRKNGVELASMDDLSSAIDTVKRNAFIDVDTTEYPTLADFLLTEGEEGYIYLYPVDTGDLSKGYHQYIWESLSWRYIGDTVINLANYVDLTSAQTISGVKTFSDVNITGNISDGLNSVSIADVANGVFNVINATDIVSNTLTQAQYDLITNGKPTLINGTYLGYKNMIITYWQEYSTTWRALAIAEGRVFSMMLNTTSKALTEGGNDLTLNKISRLNGKAIPSYPSDTGTFILKCVDGLLTWVSE